MSKILYNFLDKFNYIIYSRIKFFTSEALPSCRVTVAVGLVPMLRVAITVLLIFSGAFASVTAAKLRPVKVPRAALSVVKVTT